MYNYKVTYRTYTHPLAPRGFYTYECTANTATEAKALVKQCVRAQVLEKVKVGLIKSVPNITDMHAKREEN